MDIISHKYGKIGYEDGELVLSAKYPLAKFAKPVVDGAFAGLEKFAEKTKTKIDDGIVSSLKGWFYEKLKLDQVEAQASAQAVVEAKPA